MIKPFSVFTVLVLLLFLPASVPAQTASITGTVADTTGAVIPGAKVSAQNKTTNASRNTMTDGSGTYRITNLPPGIYGVVIEKLGFKAMEYSRVELTVDQVQNLNATLAPSSVAEKVTVTAPLAPVDLNDAQIGEMVQSQQVENLPLILRDPYQLILLSPGAIQGNSILQGLSVNGSRERNNNFLLDGTDNNDAEIPGLTLPQPGLTSLNPDSVQEFRVITSSFLPEFGRNTGAVIDIVSKRGTNDFHSDVYWFGRYDALGARDFFNHQVTNTGQVAPKDSYARNTFGIALGGPIQRDKTFWFANYDGERFDTTLTNTAIVPTLAFKTPLPSAGEPVFTFYPRFSPIPADKLPSPSASLGKETRACPRSTATTGMTLSRASESHGIPSRPAKPPFARATAFSTIAFLGSYWDSREAIPPSSRTSFSHSSVPRRVLLHKFRARWDCVLGRPSLPCLSHHRYKPHLQCRRSRGFSPSSSSRTCVCRTARAGISVCSANYPAVCSWR